MLFGKILKRLAPENSRQSFWLSALVCFFACLFILLVISPLTGLSRYFGVGHDGYIQIARNLVSGNGYVFFKEGPPPLNRPPFYPIFLTFTALFPENWQPYILVVQQSLLVGVIGMMLYKFACDFFGGRIALIALALLLINPWIYWNAKNPMTGIMQSALFMVFAWLVYQEYFGKSKQKAFLSALFLGLAGSALMLTHSAMLMTVILAFAILFSRALKFRRRIIVPVISIVLTIAIVSPWTYRNWQVFHRFVPVSSNAGLVFFYGNVHWKGITREPQQPGESQMQAALRTLNIHGPEDSLIQWDGFKDARLDRYANGKMMEYIRIHPGLFTEKCLLDAVEYYFPALTFPFLAIRTSSVENIAITIFHLVLWMLAALALAHSGSKAWWLLAAIMLYAIWFFPFGTAIGHQLYTLGTIPFLCILAGKGLECLMKKTN